MARLDRSNCSDVAEQTENRSEMSHSWTEVLGEPHLTKLHFAGGTIVESRDRVAVVTSTGEKRVLHRSLTSLGLLPEKSVQAHDRYLDLIRTCNASGLALAHGSGAVSEILRSNETSVTSELLCGRTQHFERYRDLFCHFRVASFELLQRRSRDWFVFAESRAGFAKTLSRTNIYTLSRLQYRGGSHLQS